MFNDIGQKIKKFAEIICAIGIAGSLIYGLIAFLNKDALMAIVVIIAGSLSAWIGSAILYGFGQLIENSDIIKERMEVLDKKETIHFSNVPISNVNRATDTNIAYDEKATNEIIEKMVEGKKETIKKLFQLHKISDEEYQKMMDEADS